MSDIIYTPPATGGGGGTTINPTNNVIPVRSNATTFVDSYLINTPFELYTNYGGLAIGLDINFLGKICYLGDYGNEYNNTLLATDFQNDIIFTQYFGNQIGLKLDFAGKIYNLGDFDVVFNGNALIINDANENIYTINQGQQKGLNLDFAGNIYNLGDYQGFISNTYLSIDVSNQTVLLSTNTTTFLIDGISDKLTFITNALNFVGTSLTDGATVIPVNKNLLVTINGTQYHIPLYN